MNQLNSAKGSGSLVRVGGGLGIGAVIIGLAIFIGACAGYDGALKLSFLPIVLGAPGVILTILGGVYQHNPEDTHVSAAMYPCIIGIIGGLVEMAAWLQWTIFFK